MRVLSNVCFVTDDGKFLRKITFQIVTSVVDQQGNNIPIVPDKLGQTVTVNPRFVRYIIASNNKESIQVNVVICEGDDTTGDYIHVPGNSSIYSENGTGHVIRCNVFPFEVITKQWWYCQYYNPWLIVSYRINEDDFYSKSEVSVDNKLLTFSMFRQLSSCNPPSTDSHFVDKLSINISSADRFSFECATYWNDTYMLVVINRQNYGTFYYLVPSRATNNSPFNLGSPGVKLLYQIESNWQSREFAANKIVRHGNKLYHFNRSKVDDKGNPSALRILNVSGNTITGHALGLNDKKGDKGIFLPTNLYSTKHGLLSFEGSIARMMEYYIDQKGAIKTNSIILNNRDGAKANKDSNLSINKK